MRDGAPVRHSRRARGSRRSPHGTEEERPTIARNPIPWSRLTAEAVAIVASILLAFAVDAAWSRHQASQEEELLRGRLAEELRGNLSWVDNSARAMGSLQAYAEALGDSLATTSEGAVVSVPAELIASLFYNPEWTSLETATVDGMQASGRIGLFTDPAVSERMAIWGARRASVLLRQQELRDHFNDHVLPHLSSEIDIAPFVANRDPYRGGGNGTAEFPWMGIDGRNDLTNTRMMRNLVQQRVLFLAATRIQVDAARRALERLLGTVDASGS